MALPSQVNQSWFDMIKEKLNIDEIKAYFTDLSIAHIFLYFGSGFLSGFLFKKFGKYLIFTLIVGTALIYGLHYLQVISLDIERLRNLIGLNPNDTLDIVIRYYLDWILNHIVYSILCVIGFIVGYKIG